MNSTWIRIGTASSAMTSGCLMIASPWKAKSSTSVASSAVIDHGPIFAIVASKCAWPFCSSALRQTCARITGMTM